MAHHRYREDRARLSILVLLGHPAQACEASVAGRSNPPANVRDPIPFPTQTRHERRMQYVEDAAG
jgi:hypothetical protein